MTRFEEFMASKDELRPISSKYAWQTHGDPDLFQATIHSKEMTLAALIMDGTVKSIELKDRAFELKVMVCLLDKAQSPAQRDMFSEATRVQDVIDMLALTKL